MVEGRVRITLSWILNHENGEYLSDEDISNPMMMLIEDDPI